MNVFALLNLFPTIFSVWLFLDNFWTDKREKKKEVIQYPNINLNRHESDNEQDSVVIIGEGYIEEEIPS